MKRDLDLCRQILLEVETLPANETPRMLKIEGYDERTINRHIQLRHDAGYVEGTIVGSATGGPAYGARIERITWRGHDFLDATRDEEIWARTKKKVVAEVSSAPLEIVKQVAKRLILQQLGLG